MEILIRRVLKSISLLFIKKELLYSKKQKTKKTHTHTQTQHIPDKTPHTSDQCLHCFITEYSFKILKKKKNTAHRSGGSRVSGKGFVCRYGVRFPDCNSIFLNIPRKWNNLVSLRPNYCIFIGYLKTCVFVCVCVCVWGGGGLEPSEPPIDPPLSRTCDFSRVYTVC